MKVISIHSEFIQTVFKLLTKNLPIIPPTQVESAQSSERLISIVNKVFSVTAMLLYNVA